MRVLLVLGLDSPGAFCFDILGSLNSAVDAVNFSCLV